MLVRDKKLILLLGNTGMGKSTTILYLCGEDMEESNVDGLVHIDARRPLKNKNLATVLASPLARSETSCINAIEIPNDRKNHYLCDTPGFGDTRSIEIDFSNSIGIVKALFKAESVHPVFFFSQKSIGGRGELLKECIMMYANLFQKTSDITDKGGAMTFIFTHFSREDPEKTRKEMASMLYNIKVNNSKMTDSANYVAMLDLMMEKEGKRLHVLNPLDQDYEELLSKITRSKAFYNPAETFRF
jgi:energy-coupling factor transporter ATP-binding protein EcfA2